MFITTTTTTTTTTTVTTTGIKPTAPISINHWRNGSHNNIRSLVSSDSLASSFDETFSTTPKLLQDQTKYQFQEKILMTPEIYKKLRHYLPIRTQGSDIELLFNTTNDGVSFITFYKRIKTVEQSILLIQDENGYIFGAFLSDRVEPRKDVFFGSGETFLFKIYPDFDIFRWTKENDMFIYASHDYISIGGGSMFGLWMDNEFLHGYSGPSETFNNTVLSKENDFKPYVVEVWGIN